VIEYLKPVILDLIACDQRSQAWELIDFYMSQAKTLEDYDTLGYCALKADKRLTYLECAEATLALAVTPESRYRCRMNLYKAYNAMNQPEKALFYIQQNLEITPDDFETHCHRAFNISLMGRKAEAEAILDQLCQQYPARAKSLEAAFSGRLLRQGNLAAGIQAFLETFKPKSGTFDTTLRMKRWNGVIRPGITLYVDGEGGTGDEIINIRFFDTLMRLGITPKLYSPGKWRTDTNALFSRHGYQIETDIHSIDTSCPWAPLMSLPAMLNLEECDLWSGPYLKPLRDATNQLPHTNRIRIGIKASGNPYFAQDEYRKIPVDQLLSVLPRDAEIYYIDTEPKNHPRVTDLADRITSWEHTLDFIDQMDCIVSSCTSLVHAAGAIGKTTFVAVPIAEYYIWTTSRLDRTSPWYGANFSVYRQTQVRCWQQPLAQIGQQVALLKKAIQS
jgi:tetratricopeptide (TPR) repeat protein